MDLILQDLDPRETYLKWFSSNEKIRPNGRRLCDIPKIIFQSDIVTSAEGSVMVNYGGTIIIAAIKSEVSEPDVNEPENGFLVVNFHFAAGARNDVRPGPPSEEVQSITEKLTKIIKSNVVDVKNLCIVPNALSRVLYVDTVCLCDTGYAFEASLLASLISLKRAILPVPILDEDSGFVKYESDGETRAVELTSWPCSFTFAVLNADILLLEPDFQERNACLKSRFNIVIDLLSGSIIEISKGALCLDDESLFAKIQPIISSASESVRTLLELYL